MLLIISMISTARKLSFGLCFVVISYLVIAVPLPLNAAPVVGFVAGNIIDDSVFTDKSTMTVAQIQGFLNSKVMSCDTYGLQTSEYGGGTRAQWATARGFPPPYTCLKDYTENGQSASQIIFNIAQDYNINPQVLIVLLQKEQGLITDSWPLSIQYRSATGYGCPDNAPCDSQYFGLTNQLTWSGKMFKAIMTASPAWYTPYVLGVNNIQWSPDASCGSSQVNIISRATQALYNYTPYQPNQAALNAGYGSGDGCSSYGNRNFYLYFRDWFGSTTGPAYAGLILSQGLYSDESFTVPVIKVGQKYIVTPGQKFYAKIEALNVGRADWTAAGRIGTSLPRDRFSAFYTTDWTALQRPTKNINNTISPNQTTTFGFSMQAPSVQWPFNENFDVLEEGKSWTNANILFKIDVVSPFSPVNTISSLSSKDPNTLKAGSTILSPDSYTVLSLSPGGQLSLKTNYQTVWGLNNIVAGAGSKLIMQDDGNLVLYDANMRPVWNSQTSGSGPSTLHVQEDGNLVVYGPSGPTWTTGTYLPVSHLYYTQYDMPPGSTLHVGQMLQTPDKKYSLYLQTDGNLVLYNSKNRPIWQSSTAGKPSYVLNIQKDGNIVLYSKDYRPLWTSGSFGRGETSLYLQADGNLVLYDSLGPAWFTNTRGQ